MKVIIAGSRGMLCTHCVGVAVHISGFDVTEVVSGGARGADQEGERWAEDAGIPVRRFPANWTEHGRAAGPIRNRRMAEYADALIAVWDGESRGTRNMIETMRGLGKPVYVHEVTTEGA